MKTSKIVLGIVMIVLGIGLVVGVLAASGFKLSGLGTSNPVTKEYTLDDSFRKISVGVGTADVRLVPSGESTTRVVCREDEKIRHDVAV